MQLKPDMIKINSGYIIPLVLMLTLAAGLTATGEYLGNPPAAEQSTIVEEITPEEALLLIHGNPDNPDFIILDVRTPEEFAAGHIENAVNLNYLAETFNEAVSLMDKTKSYMVYCLRGNRSGSATDMMAMLHFEEVFNMLGGIEAWQAAGLLVIQ
jgi:rhodanese-related sulfurtransferase